jgi:peptide/nickel transport system substrate-binding protein
MEREQPKTEDTSTPAPELLTRRTVLRRGIGLGLSVPAISMLLAACGGDDDDEPSGGSGSGDEPTATAAEGTASEPSGSEGEGKRGGTLIIGMVGDPPTLDLHQTTGTIVSLVTWNIYEPLFAWDEAFDPLPMLAESHEVSDDGLSHTIALRQGVPFHNGEEMKAADVIASIEHWGAISGVGKGLVAASKEIKAADDYTVEFTLNSPYGIFVSALATANGGCAIYPKSVVDCASDTGVTEFIGTGPYKFVERQADRYIRLERFEDYAAMEGEPNGYGGHKSAWVDKMEFVPAPDEAARIAGLQAGDYHYLESISPDQYESLKNDPNITAEVLPPTSWGIFILNMRSPVTGDDKIRQAFQAALDLEAIAIAGYGEGFYRMDPGLMFKETAWYTDAGAELYNQNDPEKAKQLLEEAGYDGTPLRWTVTKEYLDHYNRSVVAKQQLEEAGFAVDLVVLDWATVLSQQFEDDKWDVTTTGITFRPDPALLFVMDVCNVAGWWCNQDTVDLVGKLRSESDFDTRYGLWEQIQQNAYEQVPFIKVADVSLVRVNAKVMQGLSEQSQLGPILWNAWLDE